MSKAKDKKEAKSKRRPKAQFRASFKMRCVFSFAKSLQSLEEIQDLGDEEQIDPIILGLNFISCYKALSHCIEMLCKATLAQRSLFLILEKIDHFDNLIPKVDWSKEKSCGARIALARASKIFRKKFSNEALSKLGKIIESRNQCEHNDFSIVSFENERHFIVTALQIVEECYNSQFRAANLLEEAQAYLDESIASAYKRGTTECSSEFKKAEQSVANARKERKQFVTCMNCFYPFAQLSDDKKSYECLWCHDEGSKKVCSHDNCRNEFWSSASSPIDVCNTLHLPGLYLGSRALLGSSNDLGVTNIPLNLQGATLPQFSSFEPAYPALPEIPFDQYMLKFMKGVANPKSTDERLKEVLVEVPKPQKEDSSGE